MSAAGRWVGKKIDTSEVMRSLLLWNMKEEEKKEIERRRLAGSGKERVATDLL